MTLSASDVAEIERIIKRIVGSASAAVAAQQDGTLMSDGHRVFNFGGPGVSVSDDAVMRRTNVFIPGAPTTTGATTIVSAAGAEKIFSLSGGGISGAPANWQTVGFTDSGWSNSIALTFDDSAFYVLVPGAAWISDDASTTTTPDGVLVRRTFTIPSGSITSAQLLINVDDTFGSGAGGSPGQVDSLYLNGVNIASRVTNPATGFHVGTPAGYATLNLSPSDLVVGGTNVLAVHVFNPGPGAASPHALSYKFVINYAGAGTSSVSVREIDTVPTVAASVIEVPNGTLTDMGGGVARFTPATGSITVQEIDGSPSISATTIELPNGTVTNPSAGVARYTPAGGSGNSPSIVRLGANVTMTNANQYYDGPSITIGAGTWLLIGVVTVNNTNISSIIGAKLWDGTTVVASGEETTPASATIATAAVVTPSSSTTYKISAVSQRTGASIVAAQVDNSSGNNASYLIAWPVA